jgi:hypothetical protein
MAYFNPYLARKNKSIAYNVETTADGWNVEVVFPRKVPPSDRIKVLEWLRRYREEVRAVHPLWSTVLHPSTERYILEIRKTNSDKELIATGEQLKSICGEMLEYA